jgi:hypothetical protein
MHRWEDNVKVDLKKKYDVRMQAVLLYLRTGYHNSRMLILTMLAWLTLSKVKSVTFMVHILAGEANG